MSIFINSIAAISPQPTFDNDWFLKEIVLQQGNSMPCMEPDYKQYIPVRHLRRMSRVLKMGVSAAKKALDEVGIENPDAIIVGTGLGCLEDTEKFLQEIYAQEEAIVSPTQFIQSTHNTVASQIAIMLKCDNYNFTYTHRGFSFESALLDALLQFADSDAPQHILVGAADEITDTYIDVTRRLGQWKNGDAPHLTPLVNYLRINLPGEGTAFFVLSNEAAAHSYARLNGVRLIYKPETDQAVSQQVIDFLEENGLRVEDIDLVLLGMSGNSKTDQAYNYIRNQLFTNTFHGYFKHLCGEYKTATAFALWLAAQILDKQHIPDVLKLQPFEAETVKHILIYNNYSNINHSLLLVSHAAF